jgi:hypothetical protein
MSNLETAIDAIKAEIEHAKKGLAYYTERVSSLEQALAGIAQADTGHGNGSLVLPGKVGAKHKAANRKGRKAKSAKGTAADAGQVAELPSTGGSYWQDLVTAEPKSGRAILAEAINNLGFAPTKAQVAKLVNRMTFALNTMVKAGVIQDSGSGRERRFFKA